MKTFLFALALLLFAAAPSLSPAQDKTDTPQESQHPSPTSNQDCAKEVVVLDGAPKLVDCRGVQKNLSRKQTYSASIDSAVAIPHAASAEDVRREFSQWLLEQSRTLHTIMSCYLDADSLSSQSDWEQQKEEDGEMKNLVEGQIALLQDAVKYNKRHCK